MNRAEAINKLRDIILDHFNCQDCCHNDDHMYFNILKDIETKIGMKPPRLPEEYCQAIMSVYIMGCALTQWEEDIKKDTKVMEVFQRRAEGAEKRKIRARERLKAKGIL